MGRARQRTIKLGGIEMDLPKTWRDITDELEPGTPWTLAKPDAVGALQFSVARYKSGNLPEIDQEALCEMLKDLVGALSLPYHRDLVESVGPNMIVSASCSPEDAVVRFWLVSNGTDVVQVTYTSLELADPAVEAELEEASRIVRSMKISA